MAPQFLANLLLKFISVGGEKLVAEEDGIDGFGSKVRIIKSRTNTNGKDVHMIYDKNRGFDSLRTSFQYAKDQGLLGGNRNGYYFTAMPDGKDHKFTFKNMHEEYRENRELYKILYDNIVPLLENDLPLLTDEELEIPDEELMY